MEPRFGVTFLIEAEQEYHNLDGSIKPQVKKALVKLSHSGDTLGEALHNNAFNKLAGCRKVKLRKAGIRIVYRISPDQTVNILQIIAIGKRADHEVYEDADQRLKQELQIKSNLRQIE